jgi:tetrahydromethanopterin S-methyltransferase subunit G
MTKKIPCAVKNQDDFKSVAKRLECDEDKGRFEAKLGKIAKATVPAAGKKKS